MGWSEPGCANRRQSRGDYGNGSETGRFTFSRGEQMEPGCRRSTFGRGPCLSFITARRSSGRRRIIDGRCEHLNPLKAVLANAIAFEDNVFDLESYVPDALYPTYENARTQVVGWLTKLGVVREGNLSSEGTIHSTPLHYFDHVLQLPPVHGTGITPR